MAYGQQLFDRYGQPIDEAGLPIGLAAENLVGLDSSDAERYPFDLGEMDVEMYDPGAAPEDSDVPGYAADQLAQIMQAIAPALASAMGDETTDRRRTPGMSSPRTLPFARRSPFQVSPLRLGM